MNNEELKEILEKHAKYLNGDPDGERADLYGANIDFSCLSLCCGSLHVHFDNRQMIQILYHLLSVVSYSKYASEEMKEALLTPELCEIANKFHRVDECGKIFPADFSKEEI